MHSTTILVADDHPVFRHGLVSVIDETLGFTVVGQANNGLEVLEMVGTTEPEVVILDLEMPEMDGLETAKELYRSHPGIKTFFLTLHRERQILNAMTTINVRGYVLKDSALVEIVEGLTKVVNGEIYISPEIAKRYVEISPDLSRLTPTEAVILRSIADSMTSRSIAEKLFVSVRTVENHRFNICTKLGISGNNSLLKFALENRPSISRLPDRS